MGQATKTRYLPPTRNDWRLLKSVRMPMTQAVQIKAE